MKNTLMMTRQKLLIGKLMENNIPSILEEISDECRICSLDISDIIDYPYRWKIDNDIFFYIPKGKSSCKDGKGFFLYDISDVDIIDILKEL